MTLEFQIQLELTLDPIGTLSVHLCLITNDILEKLSISFFYIEVGDEIYVYGVGDHSRILESN